MSAKSSDSGKRRVTLSIAENVLKLGNERAEEENRSFSNYVETLILRESTEEATNGISPDEASPDADLAHRRVVKVEDAA